MPLSYEDEIEIRREAVLELASKGWTQQQIAQKLGYSQAQISKDLAVIRSRAREQLTNHYQELPMRYRMVLSNLEAIRKEAWQTVAHTQDARSKSVLFNTLIAVNREIMDVIAAGDLIEQEVANAELIAKEAKEDLQRAKEKLAEHEGKTPQIGGFELDNSLSTSSNATTQVVVDSADSSSAVALAEDIREIEEEDSSSNYDIVDDSSSDSSSGISSRSANDIVEESSSDSTNDYASVVVGAVSPVSLSDSSENLDERLNGKEKDEANDTDNDNDDEEEQKQVGDDHS
jgi:transcriptional regulator with XRE-family HTH domain